jgi:hypothetical protein
MKTKDETNGYSIEEVDLDRMRLFRNGKLLGLLKTPGSGEPVAVERRRGVKFADGYSMTQPGLKAGKDAPKEAVIYKNGRMVGKVSLHVTWTSLTRRSHISGFMPVGGHDPAYVSLDEAEEKMAVKEKIINELGAGYCGHIKCIQRCFSNEDGPVIMKCCQNCAKTKCSGHKGLCDEWKNGQRNKR